MSRITSTTCQALILALLAGGVAVADRLIRPPVDSKPYKIIVTEQALNQHASGAAIFVDARSAKRFGEGHIQGAILFDVHGDLEAGYASLLSQGVTPDQPLITYCDGTTCPRSRELSEFLLSRGHTDVSAYEEGWPAWKKAGAPTAIGDEQP